MKRLTGRTLQVAMLTALAISLLTGHLMGSEVGTTAPIMGGEVVITFGSGEPPHLNPALLSGSAIWTIGAQLFASPLRYDDDWNPLPYLAKAWEVSEDGLAVTLHLVERATFHDGHPITSEDVAFSVMAVKAYHPFQSMFAPVENVETPDPSTAILRLSHPHPAILFALGAPLLPIIPKHIYGDGQDLMTHPANMNPVGSGPFMLEDWLPGKSITLKRYDDFFIEGRPYLDRIIALYEDKTAAQVIDLERQEAHITAVFADLDGLDRLSHSDHLVVTDKGNVAIGPINWLAFNQLRPPLDDQRVRQAIAYAIDCDFIVDYLHYGRSQRADSPISPGSPFYNPSVPDYALDPAEAEQLLDEAGYPRQDDGTRFALTLDYLPILPSQEHDVAYSIQRDLEQVGIEVMVRDSANFGAWGQRIAAWDFDMTLDIVFNNGDPVIGVHRTYLCSNIRQGVLWSNTQNYCNPTVDDLLDRALVETDREERERLYGAFQMVVTQELPVLWINTVPFHTVYHTGLSNPPLTIWGMHSPLDELYWHELPDYGYMTPPHVDASEAGSLKDVGARTITLIQEHGLHEADALLREADGDFIDLEGTGRHLLAFTREGTVFLDTSDQLHPGMEIAPLLDSSGTSLLDEWITAADGNGYVTLEGAWPHPTTQELDPPHCWCGWLSEDELVCVLEWRHEE